MTTEIKLYHYIFTTLPRRVREVMIHLCKHPTERNTCYTAGYITAARDLLNLPNDSYNYLLPLCDTIQHDPVVAAKIRNHLEKLQ